jgi:hypothetical protein
MRLTFIPIRNERKYFYAVHAFPSTISFHHSKYALFLDMDSLQGVTLTVIFVLEGEGASCCAVFTSAKANFTNKNGAHA